MPSALLALCEENQLETSGFASQGAVIRMISLPDWTNYCQMCPMLPLEIYTYLGGVGMMFRPHIITKFIRICNRESILNSNQFLTELLRSIFCRKYILVWYRHDIILDKS